MSEEESFARIDKINILLWEVSEKMRVMVNEFETSFGPLRVEKETLIKERESLLDALGK